VYLTELVEPCGALPRKCLFICLFIHWPVGKRSGRREGVVLARDD
jgi:hypothetical protein